MPFFTEENIKALKAHKYSVENYSYLDKTIDPWLNYLSNHVPRWMSPNMMTLMGLFCTSMAYASSIPSTTSDIRLQALQTVIWIITYYVLDALDGKQARRTKNSSPLGEFLDHSCDSISTVFMALIMSNFLELSFISTQLVWATVQLFSLVFMLFHYYSMKTDRIVFGRFTGPTECLVMFCSLILLLNFVPMIKHELVAFLYNVFHNTNYLSCAYGLLALVNAVKLAVIVPRGPTPDTHTHNNNNNTRISWYARINVSLFMIYHTLIYVIYANQLNYFTIFVTGVSTSVVSSELILGKMAKRQLNPYIFAVLPTIIISPYLALFMVVCYYVGTISEMSRKLNVPLFTNTVNVYCCGVFDLCHDGHMNMIENASKCGDRLLVGVHSDAEVESYKRLPIMTMDERIKAVSHCLVDRVMENAPLTITKDFIEKNNIHVVVCSPEYYDDLNDTYYKDPRDLGILMRLPRTDGISTSDLIRRIKSRDDLESKQFTNTEDDHPQRNQSESS